MSETLQVSQLVYYLKASLEDDPFLSVVQVEGEISNFKNHSSGHWYFNLKDAHSRIKAVMWRSDAQKMEFIPKEGDKVLAQGYVSMYEASGEVQLYVRTLKPAGEGDLLVQLERLKKKLLDEGLFDESLKKPLPPYPMTIGLVTGKGAAGRIDTLNALHQRWPLAQIREANCLVQGKDAAPDIQKALVAIDGTVDVILLVRGGGSIEDLWCFNDEKLARTIVGLKTPLVTGIGHEIDTTIADLVADLRAMTPTQAAELAVPDWHEVLDRLERQEHILKHQIRSCLALAKNQLQAKQEVRFFKNPLVLVQDSIQELDQLSFRLGVGLKQVDQTNQERIRQLKNDLTLCFQKRFHEEKNQLQLYRQALANGGQRMTEGKRIAVNQEELQLVLAKNHYLDRRQREVFQKKNYLHALSPLTILEKGYSITLHKGKPITSITTLQKGDTVETRLENGTFESTVKEINDDHKKE